MDQNQMPRVRTRIVGNVSRLALAAVFTAAQSLNVFASLSNTVTVSGTGPTGSTTTGSDTVNLPVTTADPKLKIVKSWAFKAAGGDVNGNGLADQNDVVVYTYTITNSGNVTINDVSVNDAHDGTGPLAITHAAAASSTSSTDGNASASIWGALVPNDSIVFTAEYTITSADITGAGGGTTPDGNLNNTAAPAGTYTGSPSSTADDVAAATDPTSSGTASVPLAITSNMVVDKKAYDSLGNEITGPVSAGTVITYRYVVTNTGNVPITNVSLAESFNGTGGTLSPALIASPLTDNGTTGDSTNSGTDQIWDVLGPGDAITYEATYTVLQSDVDQLQ